MKARLMSKSKPTVEKVEGVVPEAVIFWAFEQLGAIARPREGNV
jgi:hypothetical protein